MNRWGWKAYENIKMFDLKIEIWNDEIEFLSEVNFGQL